MYEKTEVVAEFATAAEAHLALNLLQTHGVQGVLAGEDFNPGHYSVFGLMPYAPAVQLCVPESQAERAREMLADRHDDMALPSGWESQAEAVDGWICHLCDTVVEEGATVCPACQEPWKARKKKHRQGGSGSPSSIP
jgi:hypothetical protein